MSVSIFDGTALRSISGSTAAVAQTVDVVIIAGQSNPLGRGEAAALPPEVVNNVVPTSLIWNGSTSFVATTIGTINNYPVLANGDFGPEVMLSILAGKLTGKPLYIIKYCVGNTSLTLTDTTVTSWNPERTDSNSLFTDFKAQVTAALANITGQGKTPNIKLFIWGDGERDSGFANPGPEFERLQKKLFNAVRELLNLPTLPILDMLIRGEASNQASAPAVNTAKTNCATAVGNVTLMRTVAMEDIGDDTHFNGSGQLAFGRYAYELAYKKTFRLPTSLPPRTFQVAPARQEAYTPGAGYMQVAQVTDVSGAPLPLSSSETTKLPTIREGNFGRGKTAFRFLRLGLIERVSSPLPADSFYTFFLLMRDFTDYNTDSTRILARSLGSDSWLFWYPTAAVGPVNKLHVRHGSNNFMISSTALTDSGPQLYVIGYGGATGSYIRRNGAIVATSTAVVPYGVGTAFNLGNTTLGAGGLYAESGTFGSKLSDAQAQVVEGAIMHEYGLAGLLPAGHAYKSAAPV